MTKIINDDVDDDNNVDRSKSDVTFGFFVLFCLLATKFSTELKVS